jgi:hypothetical protein
MNKTSLQVYYNFRNAMLSGTDSWTELISDDVKLKGPLPEVASKANFATFSDRYF